MAGLSGKRSVVLAESFHNLWDQITKLLVKLNNFWFVLIEFASQCMILGMSVCTPEKEIGVYEHTKCHTLAGKFNEKPSKNYSNKQVCWGQYP